MEVHLKIIGILLMLLALVHTIFKIFLIGKMN